MAQTSFVIAGTGITRVGGDNAWSNPTNVEADDSSNATVGVDSGESSNLLSASNYGFSTPVPAGAVIDGIEAQVIDYLNDDDLVDFIDVFLILADNSVGTQDRVADLTIIGSSPLTDEAGGASELWGETIIRADVIDTDWGFAVRAGNASGFDTARIDAMAMKVHYSTEIVAGSGTIVGSNESQVAAGGRTIFLDLTGATWLTAGGAFDGSRQAIIDGIDSAQSEALGWNLKVRDTMGVSQVARTSSTRVTITLLAAEVGDYKITADEVLTATIPASAHSGSQELVDAAFATITAECDQTLAPDSLITQTNLTGALTDIDEAVSSPDANWLLAPIT